MPRYTKDWMEIVHPTSFSDYIDKLHDEYAQDGACWGPPAPESGMGPQLELPPALIQEMRANGELLVRGLRRPADADAALAEPPSSSSSCVATDAACAQASAGFVFGDRVEMLRGGQCDKGSARACSGTAQWVRAVVDHAYADGSCDLTCDDRVVEYRVQRDHLRPHFDEASYALGVSSSPSVGDRVLVEWLGGPFRGEYIGTVDAADVDVGDSLGLRFRIRVQYDDGDRRWHASDDAAIRFRVVAPCGLHAESDDDTGGRRTTTSARGKRWATRTGW